MHERTVTLGTECYARAVILKDCLENGMCRFFRLGERAAIVLSASALLKDRFFSGLALSAFVSCRDRPYFASGLMVRTCAEETRHEYKFQGRIGA
jgi:hypothetical protein